jgi:hypothetical protein
MAVKGSAAELGKYLKGIDFPASKEDLLKRARENDAPSEVIDMINGLIEDRFNSLIDVSKAFGETR